MASARKAKKCVAASFIFFLKGLVYMWWCGQVSDYGWFFPLFGSHLRCRYEPLPPNQTGLKVLTIGIAKTGTRTMARTLHELGYERSYHSEEIFQNIWHTLASDYWARPENGGHLHAPIGTVYAMRNDTMFDDMVFRGTPNLPEVWADHVSRCRADAVVFDGLEGLINVTIDTSPDAKVLLTDWRTHAEMRRSGDVFVTWQWCWMLSFVCTNLGLHFLPWNVFYHITEPLFGWPLERFFAAGAPALNQFQTPMTLMYLRHYTNTLLMGHLYSGLSLQLFMSDDEEGYNQFWDDIRKKVPPERRMSVDPRKTTYEEICAFLGLSPCKRSGKLGKAINVAPQDFDFFPSLALMLPIWLVVHWVNWQVLYWVCGHLKRGAKRALGPLRAS